MSWENFEGLGTQMMLEGADSSTALSWVDGARFGEFKSWRLSQAEMKAARKRDIAISSLWAAHRLPLWLIRKIQA